MKRGGPLRRTPFRRKPEHKGLNRKRKPIHPPRPPVREGPLTSAEWKLEVFRAYDFSCAVTGIRLNLKWDHAHHVIPAQFLRRHGYSDRLYDPRNGMALARRVHERHEQPGASWERWRIARSLVPASAWEFAEEIGSDAVLKLEQCYPINGRRE